MWEFLKPYIANTTRRSRALTVSQTVCIALRFFACGTFLYSVGDAEMICDSTCLITNVVAKWPGSVHDSRIFQESTLCHSFDQDPAPGPQACFNGALARKRARIERTFGQLKARFTCLRGLWVAPDRACDIAVACAVLHNVATIRKERVPVIMDHPEDDLQPVHLDEQNGPAARDRIAHHHFS
ncbi:putative nuclease HARBI1 [Lycodopsis pacificus]